MTKDLVKKFLPWVELALLGGLALKMFGVQLVHSWGAWWLMQIIVLLVYAALFIDQHKVEIGKKIEEIQKKSDR